MISPHRFKWNEKSSLDFYVLTQFAFDGDSGETDTYLSRDAVISDTYNNALRRGVNYKWSETFESQITLIKEDFSDFTPSENRRILSWLTGKQTPGYLTLYSDDSEVIFCEILGNFTQVQQYKLGNGRIVGYVATFTSLLPYPMSAIKTYPEESEEEVLTITTPQTITIKCLTDEAESFVYPQIKIKEANSVVVIADDELGSTFQNNQAAPAGYVRGTVYQYNGLYYWVGLDGKMIGSTNNTSGLETTSVVIENLTTNTRTEISGNTRNEEIVIDGANRIISRNSASTAPISDDFNWQWLPLQYGDNEIKITGNCTIQFKFRYPVKCGDYVG